jgi:hypothetical protein
MAGDLARVNRHDEGADRERGRHRAAAPPELPRAGRLPVADPPWEFFGGYPLDPPVGPAEYELMTRTAQTAEQPEQPEADPGDETPSDFTRRQVAEVEAMIAGWEARGNYDRHLIQAEHLTRN